MRPRYEDERMGYFSSVKTVYNTVKRVYRPKYVSRWRIEPRPEDVVRYQAGELVEPARPIVFYFDPATPELIKKYARLGILDWNTRRIIGARFIFFTFDTDIIMV